MTKHYLAIEQNWRLLLESFGEARQSTGRDGDIEPKVREELLTRLETLEITLRALESCWKPIREKVHVEQAEEEENVPQTIPRREYFLPLLRVPCEHGGRMQAKEAVEATEQVMKNRLLPKDYEPGQTGSIRYDYNTRFAREALKKLGLIKPKEVYGQWEITDAGRRANEHGRIPTQPVEATSPGQMSLFS